MVALDLTKLDSYRLMEHGAAFKRRFWLVSAQNHEHGLSDAGFDSNRTIRQYYRCGTTIIHLPLH